jgi:hypothetical protein
MFKGYKTTATEAKSEATSNSLENILAIFSARRSNELE